jgi:hypothetical protein
MGVFIKERNGMTFNEAIDQLIENIKKDYCKWSSNEGMIEEFKEKVRFTRGRKYTKILNGNSVWGFVANGDGVLKGIPYKKGDVFKAAGWRAPSPLATKPHTELPLSILVYFLPLVNLTFSLNSSIIPSLDDHLQ